jgi:hypothetical protein
VPNAPAIAQDNRVHGPQRRHVGRKLVKMRNDGLFARMGDVEAGKSHSLGRLKQLRQIGRAKAETLQIDLLVQQAQTLLIAFTLMHCWRARTLDTGPNQSDQEGRS